MEENEKALLDGALKSGNRKLKRLYDEHTNLNERVSQFERRGFLTSSEELELKKLKVQKLTRRDEMMDLIRMS